MALDKSCESNRASHRVLFMALINEVFDQISQTDFGQSASSVYLGVAPGVFHPYIGVRNSVY